jgi:hypothetical protein
MSELLEWTGEDDGAWDRRDGSVFVAPLVAATLARFGAMTAGRPRTNRRCSSNQ